MKPSFARKFSLLICLIITQVCVFAQTAPKKYLPIEDNKEMQSNAKADVALRRQKWLENAPKAYPKPYKQIINEIFDDRQNDLDENYYVFDARFDAFFSRILTEIKRANPALPLEKVDYLVSRSSSPNAYMTLDGVMIFNLGMLEQCANESEVAAIICHEMAHYLEKHGEIGFFNYLDKTYSKEGQKELKKLARTPYNRYEKTMKFATEWAYDRARHSREKESEADSIGFSLLRNTKYNAHAAVNFLATLDRVDTLIYAPLFSLEEVFRFEGFPFKKSWTKAEEVMFGGNKLKENAKFVEDSLKTHPDCAVRARHAKEVYLVKYDAEGKLKNMSPDTTFDNLRKLAAYETIVLQYRNDNLDFAFFKTLNMLQKYPDDVFLKLVAAQSLLELYDARKEHTFSKYVSLPSEYMKEHYQPFLRLLNNASKIDLASWGYYYLKQQGASIPADDEAFMFFSAKAAYYLQKKDEYQELKGKFLAMYPACERAKKLNGLKPLDAE